MYLASIQGVGYNVNNYGKHLGGGGGGGGGVSYSLIYLHCKKRMIEPYTLQSADSLHVMEIGCVVLA